MVVADHLYVCENCQGVFAGDVGPPEECSGCGSSSFGVLRLVDILTEHFDLDPAEL